MRVKAGPLILLLACAPAPPNPAPAGDPNRIVLSEIQATDAQNALEVVQRLRPRWLVQRTDRSTRLETVILVYQNETRLGGLDMLREILVPMIQSMRVLDAAEAGLLPGLGSQHVERVIQVITRTR